MALPVLRGGLLLAVVLPLAGVSAPDDPKPGTPPAPATTPAAGGPRSGSPEPSVKPAEPKPDAKPDPKPADARPAAATPTFPAAVEKPLYATSDLRGKAAPKLEIGKWLGAEPDRKGKVVLVDFWATWCPPCRLLIPELEAFQKAFKDDLVVIGVSGEKAQVVQNFMDARGGVGYTMALDDNGATKQAVGVQGLPHVLVIGTDNVVRWQGYPLAEQDRLTAEKLRQIIDADKALRAQRGAAGKSESEKGKADKGPSDRDSAGAPAAKR